MPRLGWDPSYAAVIVVVAPFAVSVGAEAVQLVHTWYAEVEGLSSTDVGWHSEAYLRENMWHGENTGRAARAILGWEYRYHCRQSDVASCPDHPACLQRLKDILDGDRDI